MDTLHPLQRMLEAAAATESGVAQETRCYRVTVIDDRQVHIREEALELPRRAVPTCFEFLSSIGDSLVLWSMHDTLDHDTAYWLAAHIAEKIGWTIGWTIS